MTTINVPLIISSCAFFRLHCLRSFFALFSWKYLCVNRSTDQKQFKRSTENQSKQNTKEKSLGIKNHCISTNSFTKLELNFAVTIIIHRPVEQSGSPRYEYFKKCLLLSWDDSGSHVTIWKSVTLLKATNVPKGNR